ncbi:MAG: hypothetical protein V1808_04175 [Candidatus Daviesbacteria bacterium]
MNGEDREEQSPPKLLKYFPAPPWNIPPEEIEKRVKEYLSENPNAPSNLPITELVKSIALERIFEGSCYDDWGHILIDDKHKILKVIDSTWQQAPQKVKEALWYWRRAEPVMGGAQVFISKNYDAIHSQYDQVRECLRRNFGDILYLWRGCGLNASEQHKFTPSSRPPFTSYSASYWIASHFQDPVRLFAVPTDQVIAVLHGKDDPANANQAEFIVDTRTQDYPYIATANESLDKFLMHFRRINHEWSRKYALDHKK